MFWPRAVGDNAANDDVRAVGGDDAAVDDADVDIERREEAGPRASGRVRRPNPRYQNCC